MAAPREPQMVAAATTDAACVAGKHWAFAEARWTPPEVQRVRIYERKYTGAVTPTGQRQCLQPSNTYRQQHLRVGHLQHGTGIRAHAVWQDGTLRRRVIFKCRHNLG
jgi:hypothetical protein